GAVESYNAAAARRLGSDLKGTQIRDLALDSVFVWVATDSGVSRYDREPPYAVESLRDSLGAVEAFTVENLGGTIYAGTKTGVYTWRPASHAWRKVRNFDPMVCPSTDTFPARSIARLPDGRLFAGSDVAVEFFNNFCWGELAPNPTALIEQRYFPTIVTTG